MLIEYIYDQNGQATHVVVPVSVWDNLKQHLEKPFNPSDYHGFISHLNLDIEQEIQTLRSEWNRDF